MYIFFLNLIDYIVSGGARGEGVPGQIFEVAYQETYMWDLNICCYDNRTVVETIQNMVILGSNRVDIRCERYTTRAGDECE